MWQSGLLRLLEIALEIPGFAAARTWWHAHWRQCASGDRAWRAQRRDDDAVEAKRCVRRSDEHKADHVTVSKGHCPSNAIVTCDPSTQGIQASPASPPPCPLPTCPPTPLPSDCCEQRQIFLMPYHKATRQLPPSTHRGRLSKETSLEWRRSSATKHFSWPTPFRRRWQPLPSGSTSFVTRPVLWKQMLSANSTQFA
jgi:hypothetical protein